MTARIYVFIGLLLAVVQAYLAPMSRHQPRSSLRMADVQPQSTKEFMQRGALDSSSSGSRLIFAAGLAALAGGSAGPRRAFAAEDPNGIKGIAIEYDGVKHNVEEYLGSKGTLIVNVASQCALTPQYEELVAVYDKYKDMGFNILAFPCNQFGSQEPAPVPRIRKDMQAQFGVQFPIFDKIDVNGGSAAPIYKKLKSYEGIGVSNIVKVSWNFEKFLVDASGMPVRRYKPGILPTAIEGDLLALLKTGKVPPKKKASLNDY